MRSVSRLAVVTALFCLVGCKSNNEGKIEATRWTSIACTVKGVEVPPDMLQLSFGGDGRMIYRIENPATAADITHKGTYSLGMGDFVTLNLDEPLAGSKTHMQMVKIDGNQLTMIDSDGTSMTFNKK